MWAEFLDVVAVQPVQLFKIENSRRRSNPLQRKFLDQLLFGENFARAAGGRPAEQRQVIDQSFGEHTHVTKVCDGSCTVALGEPLAIAAEDGGEVSEFGHRPAQRLI